MREQMINALLAHAAVLCLVVVAALVAHAVASVGRGPVALVPVRAEG